MNKPKDNPKIDKTLETQVRTNLDSSIQLDIPTLNSVKPSKISNTKPSTDKIVSKSTNSKKTTTSSEAGKLLNTKHKKNIIGLLPNDDTYFVYLNTPLEYRRHILESSRKILFCLRSHQKILLIRQKKLEELKRLKGLLKEILYLNRKFKEKLPKYHEEFLEYLKKDKDIGTKHLPKNNIPIKPQIPIDSQIQKDLPKEKTELEKLEDSLASIEAKLKNL